MTLNDYNIGQKGKVEAVFGENKLRRRLFDMGLTPGAEVEIVKIAPLGDPMEVSLRGYNLCLRRNEAKTILMTDL